MRPSGLVAVAIAALVLSVLVSSPAQAVVRASTGVRCTIVGTRGPDHLHGTSHRDVICGLGGNDRIDARGGDDVIRGGPGADVIHGGKGADRILGGAGRDTVYGEAGNDLIHGGDGADRLSGGAGPDSAWGEGGDDTVDGGAGVDYLVGGPGADQMSGGDQGDIVHAGAGDDKVWGGAGDDFIYGEGGADDVYGERGVEMIWGGDQDDHLNGGAGTDQIWGGAGGDVCRYDVYDWLDGCEADNAPPKVLAVSISPSAADSDTGDTSVTVRVHATDDLWIGQVQAYLTGIYTGNPTAIYMPLELVSGGARDGWWQDTVTLPRWTPGGVLEADVWVPGAGPYGIGGVSVRGGRLEVTSTSPDTFAPKVSITSVSTTSVDVRSASKVVKIAVHGVDEQAGVRQISICIDAPGLLGWATASCVVGSEVSAPTSGTIHDGVWTAALAIPKGFASGTYNVVVGPTDRIGNTSTWMGPDAYAGYIGGGSCCLDAHELPADISRVQVTGS